MNREEADGSGFNHLNKTEQSVGMTSSVGGSDINAAQRSQVPASSTYQNYEGGAPSFTNTALMLHQSRSQLSNLTNPNYIAALNDDNISKKSDGQSSVSTYNQLSYVKYKEQKKQVLNKNNSTMSFCSDIQRPLQMVNGRISAQAINESQNTTRPQLNENLSQCLNNQKSLTSIQDGNQILSGFRIV